MNNISQYLTTIERKKPRSERAELLEQIYSFYVSQSQKTFRRKENWKRYVEWLKQNRINEKTIGRENNMRLFKKTKRYIKEHSLKTICIFLSHIPTSDLYYITSVGRDMEHRGHNFGSYLLSSIFGQGTSR
jgi:hypothetical protein